MQLIPSTPFSRVALRPHVVIALVCLALLLVSCRSGGNTDSADRVDPSKVPTQTLPSTLPDPIMVSGPGGRGTPTPAAALESYVVRSGDTLAAIAVRYNTTVEALVRENGLTDAGRLEVGQTLKVPRIASVTPTPAGSRTPTPSATAAGSGTPRPGSPTPTSTGVPGAIRTATPTGTAGGTRTPTTAAGSGQVYVVKSGDTASGIASALGITVQDLAAANDLTVAELANLRVGQELRIPRR
jgi:LysM repeat protein